MEMKEKLYLSGDETTRTLKELYETGWEIAEWLPDHTAILTRGAE